MSERLTCEYCGTGIDARAETFWDFTSRGGGVHCVKCHEERMAKKGTVKSRKYKVAHGTTIDSFEESVEVMMEKGFVPHGSMWIVNGEGFFQAMMRKRK